MEFRLETVPGPARLASGQAQSQLADVPADISESENTATKLFRARVESLGQASLLPMQKH